MNTNILAKAIRDERQRLKDATNEGQMDLQDAAQLLSVLACVVEGRPLNKAFGAPGDWGYGTPIGDALAAKPDSALSASLR